MAIIRKGSAEDKAKLLFSLYNIRDGKEIERDEFALVTKSMRETAVRIAQVGIMGAALAHVKAKSIRFSRCEVAAITQIANYPVTKDSDQLTDDNRLLTSSNQGSLNSFVRCSASSNPVLQRNARELFEPFDAYYDQVDQQTNELFERVFKRDKAKEKQFVEWATNTPRALDVLEFYGERLATLRVGTEKKQYLQETNALKLVDPT
eukprot:CAMPEP_0201549414 /NCGR_PEP_ID=MMETSP0173_2-20130828/5892_1 /ASSEMBLY_ACC=CAM_ASM_000268 /TAXON_ID=218659 /ORGANISM="Vexillifera sp., Strain DIVA3 564/2" /LENGTH=205 /DNA_ID=CAMNT_0047959081 /DNA_START=235 /DNA_END=848 /DNA_ORIENTATION=+